MKDLLGRMTISEWVSSLIALTVGVVVPPVLSRGHAPLQVLALAGAGMALGVFVLTRERGFWFLLIPAWQIAAALVLYLTPEAREFFRGSNGLPFAVGFSPWCSAPIPGMVRELRNRQPAPARNHVAWGDGTRESWKYTNNPTPQQILDRARAMNDTTRNALIIKHDRATLYTFMIHDDLALVFHGDGTHPPLQGVHSTDPTTMHPYTGPIAGTEANNYPLDPTVTRTDALTAIDHFTRTWTRPTNLHWTTGETPPITMRPSTRR